MTIIDDIFFVIRGTGGYIEDFEDGDTPLVSATNWNNGVVRLVKSEPKFKAPAITVERVKGTAFVQLVDFVTVPDDLSVLIPKEKMSLNELYAIASIINNSKWRFSYSRKLSPTRLKKIPLSIQHIDNIKIQKKKDVLPKQEIQTGTLPTMTNLQYVKIDSLFDLHSGDYHNASSLQQGNTPLISCGDIDNGIVMYCSVPKSHRYRNTITIAYNGQPLTTKLHPYEFAAKDDVAVCVPKKPLKTSTLVFLQCLIDKEKWRFSYGRKCFREKLRSQKLQIPIKSDGSIDEDIIEKIVNKTSYWKYFSQHILN